MNQRLFSLLVLLASMTTPAAAATVTKALVRSEGSCASGFLDQDQSTTGSALAAGSASVAGSPRCGFSALAIADRGYVSTKSSVGSDLVGGFASEATASFRADFGIIVPTGVDPFALIPVQVAFDVDALLFADAPTDTPQGTAQASYRFKYSVSGSQGPSNTATAARSIDWDIVDSSSPSNSGGIAPVSEGIFSSLINIVPAGGLNVFFQGESRAAVNRCRRCPMGNNAFSNAGDTASFAQDGPAFILPEGYFVNAPELGIVNNYWIDPRDTTSPSPVPLPATLPLLALSGGLLAAMGRRKKRA